MTKVYISQTKNLGKGLFAKSNIRKDETISIVKCTIERHSYDSQFYLGTNWLALKKRLWISPLKNNPWKFINHSCSPNVGLSKVTVVAKNL